jgi:hypothetical protein
MPFQKYSPFFAPEELRALTAAYDATWQQLACEAALNDAQAAVLKRNLAQIILASACNGEREPERLKRVALRALGQPPKRASPAGVGALTSLAPDGGRALPKGGEKSSAFSKVGRPRPRPLAEDAANCKTCIAPQRCEGRSLAKAVKLNLVLAGG